VYVEGNIETRIYNDPNTQQMKRIREIAVRQNGIFMPSYVYLVVKLTS
jgi:hypothetical protein